MQTIKVLYIFDKYLNRTMNWAHRLIVHTPNISPIIAAPLIVENEFYEKEWDYIFSPYQWETVEDEWGFSFLQKKMANGAVRVPSLYKKWLIKKMREENLDMIQVFFGTTGADYLDVYEALNIPMFVYFLGYDFENAPLLRPKYREKYRKLFASNAHFIVGGNDCKKKIIEIGAKPDRVHLVRLAIDPNHIVFHPIIKKKNKLTLLQACTIKAKKGHYYTIRAFKKALKSCPNMHLTIAGENFDKQITSDLKDYIKIHKLEDKVELVPLFTYPEFIETLNKCDVFIHPSITSDDKDRETAPVAMQDAHATGTPCISTTHADIPEQIIHNKTGLLAPERDIETLARHIQRFYKMENEEYQEFAKAGRKHIEDHYDVRKSGKDLREVYYKVLSNLKPN